MRFFRDFPEALNELRRELKEMGTIVTTKSVQNLVGDVSAYEVQNYQYLVTQANYNDIPEEGLDLEWCKAEFEERVSGKDLNPGEAWKLREAYWKQFINSKGKFDYAYSQRMSLNLENVINVLKKDLSTRRAFLPIIDIIDDDPNNLEQRFPCSLGYLFQYRQDKLNMTYLLRSSDYFEHLPNDLWLANRLQYYVAEKVGVESGYFCHWIGSLHCFTTNVKDVF